MVLRVHGAQKVKFRSKRNLNLISFSMQEGSPLPILNLLNKGYILCEIMDLISLLIQISRVKFSLDNAHGPKCYIDVTHSLELLGFTK